MSESAVRQYEIRYDDRGYYAGRRTLSGGYAPPQQWGTYYVPGPDGERHGWLDFAQVGSYDDPRREVHVEYIEVDGHHRGQGIASALMDHLYAEHPEPAEVTHSLYTEEGTAWRDRYLQRRPHIRERQAAAEPDFEAE